MNLRTRLGIKPEEDMIWFLIRVQSPWWVQIMAVIGFLAIFYLPYRSFMWACVFLSSVWLHEAGHHLVFILAKIKSRIMFLFPLGAVAAPISKEENARSDKLPHNTLAWLTQAGLIVNVALMLVGKVLLVSGSQHVEALGKDLLEVNVILILFNILPIWKLDARIFWKIVFSSMKEENEKMAALPFVLIAIAAVIGFFLTPFSHWTQLVLRVVMNIGWWLIPVIIGAGIWQAQGSDDPSHALTEQAMTSKQILLQLVVYVALVALTLFVGIGNINWYA